MTAAPLSADAEQSCQLINRTLAAHRDAIDALSSRPGPPRRLPAATEVDREQLQRQATLVRFLSITEAFCTERLLSEMEGVMASTRHDGVGAIWEDAYDRAIGSWKGQQDAFMNWLGVPRDLWTDVLQLTTARNAVAHGFGQLTQKQRRMKMQARQQLETNLRRHDIYVDGIRVILTEGSVTKAAASCQTMIVRIDEALAT